MSCSYDKLCFIQLPRQVDEQGMIAQEFTLWDTPGKRKTYIASFLLT